MITFNFIFLYCPLTTFLALSKMQKKHHRHSSLRTVNASQHEEKDYDISKYIESNTVFDHVYHSIPEEI